MKRSVKEAKGFDGKKLHVGDLAEALSYKNEQPLGVVFTILEIWHQGYDGTIVRCDLAPDPDYPHHFNHRAKYVLKRS